MGNEAYLKSRILLLGRVSTGSDSDLVSDHGQYSRRMLDL